MMFAGPTRGLGKSFVSVNFAAVMAATGKRVLLIDADFRSGQLHRYFGVSRDQGLSKAINDSVPLGDIIHHDVLENLDFIPTGPLPPNRTDFLLTVNFNTVLDTVSENYDLVLIDAAPLLQAADALIVGDRAGAIFLVARARVTTDTEIAESVKRLNHAGLSPQGVLFNDMTSRFGRLKEEFTGAPIGRLNYYD